MTMTSSTTTELLLVGKTPLVQLDRLIAHFGLSDHDHNYSMYAKCEFLQYGGHGSFWNRWAEELLCNLPLPAEEQPATDRVKLIIQQKLLNIHWPSAAEKLAQCDDENAEKAMQLGWHCWPLVHALCACAVAMGMYVQLTVQKEEIYRHQQIKNTLGALGVQMVSSSAENDCKHCSNSEENVFCLRLNPQQKCQQELSKDDGNINSLMCKAYCKTMKELVKELKCQLGRMLPDRLSINGREYCPPFMSIEKANAFWSELAEKEGGRMKVICCNEKITSNSNGHHHIVNGVPNNSSQQLKNGISTVCADSSTIDAVHSALGCLEGMLCGRGSAIAVAGALQSQQLSASKLFNGNSHESRFCVILLADGILHSPSADSDSFNMQNNGKQLFSSYHFMNGLFNNESDQQNGFKMGKEQMHQHNNETLGTMTKNNERKQLKQSLISENETIFAHGKALPNILHAIGQTPLLELNGIIADLLHAENCVDIFAKCEFANPGGSTKDRVALSMVNQQMVEMEQEEVKKEELTIIEPTAGNTGNGLAMVAAVYGLRCICVMPQKMSADKEGLLRSLGAQIVRTPNTSSSCDPDSYIATAHRMAQQMQRQNSHQKPKALCLDQCSNAGNPQAHYEGTGAEIVTQMAGAGRRIDALVIGAATGGTLTGIGRRVREQFSECKIIAVEPCGSRLSKELLKEKQQINNNENLKKEEVQLEYHEIEDEKANVAEKGNSSRNSYKLEGLGLDFVPAVFEPGLVDEWIRVRDVDAFRMARLLNRRGIPCGGSSGAALWAALEVARQMGEKNMKNPKNGQRSALVTLFPDGMRNYLSTFLDDGWLIENGFSELLDEKQYHDHSINGNNTINVNENFHTVQPPMELSKPMNIQKVALFGSGPTELCKRVYNAMQNPMLSPLNPQFLQVLEDVKHGLKYMFQTRNALTFAVSGTGHAGLECALVNLLEAGERLLVVENGRWGQCVQQIASRMPNVQVHTLQVPWGQTVPLKMFEKAIHTFQPHLVYVCHGESSTGVLQSLHGFGPACHAHGALLLVDAVASLGVVPLETDLWELDCVFAASQKVLNCPPGLAPITFSERAIAKIKGRKTPVSSYYFDALELGSMWNCCAESSINGEQERVKRKFHHTLPIIMLYALREGLAHFVEGNGGLAASWERHRRAAEYLRHKLVNELGLELFVKEECNRLPSMTTVVAPPGFADDPSGWDLFSDGMLEKGFELSNGLGALCNRVWRIAMFGQQTANVAKIDALLEAIKQQMSLKQQQKRKQ